MTDIILCKDCIHFIPARKIEYIASHNCGAIQRKAFVELVTGTTEPAANFSCYAMRMVGKKCGPDAKLFKPNYAAAQAIEARRVETGTGSVHESAVRQDAPISPSEDQTNEG